MYSGYKVLAIKGNNIEIGINNGHGGTSSTTMSLEKFKENFGKDPVEGDLVNN